MGNKFVGVRQKQIQLLTKGPSLRWGPFFVPKNLPTQQPLEHTTPTARSNFPNAHAGDEATFPE